MAPKCVCFAKFNILEATISFLVKETLVNNIRNLDFSLSLGIVV